MTLRHTVEIECYRLGWRSCIRYLKTHPPQVININGQVLHSTASSSLALWPSSSCCWSWRGCPSWWLTRSRGLARYCFSIVLNNFLFLMLVSCWGRLQNFLCATYQKVELVVWVLPKSSWPKPSFPSAIIHVAWHHLGRKCSITWAEKYVGLDVCMIWCYPAKRETSII